MVRWTSLISLSLSLYYVFLETVEINRRSIQIYFIYITCRYMHQYDMYIILQIFSVSSEVEMLQTTHVDKNASDDCFSHHGATVTIPEVKDAYKLLGLPKETGIDRAAMISRLKHYMIWQDLRLDIDLFFPSCWKGNLKVESYPPSLRALKALKFEAYDLGFGSEDLWGTCFRFLKEGINSPGSLLPALASRRFQDGCMSVHFHLLWLTSSWLLVTLLEAAVASYYPISSTRA